MYFILSLIYALVMAEVCNGLWCVLLFSTDTFSRSSPFFFPLLERTCRISNTDQMIFSELFHGAYKEASFLAASDDRPLYIIPRHLTKHPLVFFFFSLSAQHFYLGCTLLNKSYCRTKPGQRRGPNVTECIPFFLAAFSQIPKNGSNGLAHGPWMSYKSARWEAGHQTGITCESWVVIDVIDHLSTVPGVQLLATGDLNFLAWPHLLFYSSFLSTLAYESPSFLLRHSPTAPLSVRHSGFNAAYARLCFIDGQMFQ